MRVNFQRLSEYRADENRVYLTGLSFGGAGSWHLAMTYPDRWAAGARCAGRDNEDVERLVVPQPREVRRSGCGLRGGFS